MIWDLHCHLNGVNGRTPEERMAQLLKYADRMGIDRLIIFLGMSFSRSYDPKPDDFRQQNDEVIQGDLSLDRSCFGFCLFESQLSARILGRN